MADSLFATPEFFSTTLYIIGSISIPIHLFGGYCILFQTPEIMKSVKWSMFNLHFWSAFCDLTVSILTQPYFLKSTWAAFPLGILKYSGVPKSIQSYMVTTAFTLVSVSVIAIFENRFNLIFAENTWWKYGRIVFLGINYILALLYYVPTVISFPDQEKARKLIFELHPEFRVYDTPEHPVFVGVAYDDTSVSTRQILMELFLLIEAFSFVGILHFKMKNVVKNLKLSESTARMQRKFLKTIYIQIALPFLVILVPSIVSIFSGILGIPVQNITNMVYITFSLHGLTSTIIMLSIQKPYREFCLRIFRPQYWSARNNVFSSIANLRTENPRKTTLF